MFEFLKFVMYELVFEFSVLMIILCLMGFVILIWWYCRFVGSGVIF